MAATYEAISTNTLGSAAATVTFSSIPGTYTDLILVAQFTVTAGNANIGLYFNGSEATDYSFTGLGGSGGAVVSTNSSNATNIQTEYYGYGDQTQATRIINVMNYANTTTHKTVIGRANNTNNGTSVIVGLWRSTAAITSTTILAGGTTFTSGSTFTLYGIKAA